jgi:hypothetical protein
MMPRVCTSRHSLGGLRFSCPECDQGLRVESPLDWPLGDCPKSVGQVGGFTFVLRCDACGCRVEMKGNRLPTVQMLGAASP